MKTIDKSFSHLKSVLMVLFFIFLFFDLALGENERQKESAKNQSEQSAVERPEFRGLWITRFEWPSENPEETKQNIINVMKDLDEANFNAAVFQIRGEAETLYPSPYEPWSPLIGGKDPGFDPLKLAIEEAHKRGIQFHAYINPMPLASSRGGKPPEHSTPEHLYYLHGPESSDPWICCDENGSLMNARSAEYWYLSPNIPEVQVYLRKVILDVVKRYDVDGIHLDRIRFPGPQYSHDKIAKARFYGRGNPNRKEWFDWQREQLNKFINDLYAEIMTEKPNVILSCAAWGIYNRYNIKGYDKFSSGYHDYYQDTWEWIRLGAMDVLMPMIYWNIPDPKPNYNELVDDFIQGIGANRLIGGQRMYGDSWETNENINEIKYSREKDILGTVIFSYGSAKKRGAFEEFKKSIYQNKAPLPVIANKMPEMPELMFNGMILGTVTDEDGKPLVDAWVSLIVPSDSPRKERVVRTWTSGADGRFAFLNMTFGAPIKLIVEYDGAEKTEIDNILALDGVVKKIDVTIKGAKEAREQVFFHIFSPEDSSKTEKEVVNLLGKTMPENKIKIGDKDVEVFSTGAFALDNIPLNMGENKLQISATNPQGKTTTRSITIIRKEPQPVAPVSTIEIQQPAEDVSLISGDVLEIKVKGPSGLKGYAQCWNRRFKFPLNEALDENNKSTGDYYASFRIPANFSQKASPVIVRFEGKRGLNPFKKKPGAISKAKVEVWNSSQIRVGETIDDKTGITFGTHYVRLGGPYLTEIAKSTRFEISGKLGNRFRIKLTKSLSGWISERNVVILPRGTPIPQAFFTSCEITGDENYDKLVVPVKENVVYAITSETESPNFLNVDFFNTHYAVTWMSHKSGAKVIGTVTGEQVEDGWTRLKVPIKSKQIWGYWAEKDENGLTIFIKRPPKIAEPPDSPVKGLLFAIEAGHGGAGSGAVGLMGTNEKSINLMAVTELKKQLEYLGGKIILVRPGDSSPTLEERVQTANDANADLFISIHANAAGTERGFLRVSGTSTYFKDKHCEPLAKLIYDELLKLGWGEFGVVGNFHYYPLRNTRIPAILIEQAFMSHIGDEARLLDPEYQKEQAKVVVKAIEEFLNTIK